MILITHHLVPYIVGSGFGFGRDGCGIRLCRCGCGAEGVLHLAAGGFAGHGHKRFLRSIVGAVVGGDGGGDGVLLANGYGHVFGRLRIGSSFRCRDSDVSFAVCRNFLDRQCAGGGIHVDVVSAAFLDRIADVSTACRRIGHSGADALIRVAIGGGHIFSRDCLCALVADRQRAVCIADRVISTCGCT